MTARRTLVLVAAVLLTLAVGMTPAGRAEAVGTVVVTPTADTWVESVIDNSTCTNTKGPSTPTKSVVAQVGWECSTTQASPSGDTTASKAGSNGQANLLSIGGTGRQVPLGSYVTNWTTLLDFDLSVIPSTATLTSATLKVHGDAAGDDVLAFIVPIDGAWSESTTQLPSINRGVQVVETIVAGGSISVDVTDQVMAWSASDGHGLALGLADVDQPGRVEIYSREQGSLQAELSLEWVGDDTQDPTVTITSPQPSDQVFEHVDIVVDATDDTAVSKVEFSIDGVIVATDTGAPFDFSWDSTTVPDGDHLIEVVATDTAGRQATDFAGVTVINGGDAAIRLDADLAAERITVDDYVMGALRAAFEDPTASPRYGNVEVESASTWLYGVMSNWPNLTPATQQWIDDYLAFEIPPSEQQSSASTPGAQATAPSARCGLTSYELPADFVVDCYLPARDTTLFWNSADLASVPDANANGIPDSVDDYAVGLVFAETHYTSLAFTRPGTSVALVVLNGDDAISVDPGVILLPKDVNNDASLAAHELFHQFQYQYRPTRSATVADSAVWWWLEATATWAEHQVADTYSFPTNYDRHIDVFFDQSDHDLDDFELLRRTDEYPYVAVGGQRQYGSFAVAEWLHDTLDDADVIRRTWDRIATGSDPLPAIDSELEDAGRPGLEASLGDMWQDLYFLDLSIPGRIDQSTVDLWRQELASPTPYGVGRMPAISVAGLELGDSEGFSASIEEGGAVAVEVDGNDAGPLVFEGGFAGANTTRTEVRAFALADFDTDPATGPSTCADATVTTDTIGGTFRVEVVDYDPAVCEGVTVLFVNRGWDGESVAVEGLVGLGEEVDTTITNGTIRLGLHPEGHLNVEGFNPSSGTGTSMVGLRYEPTNADALSPGCLCEGWGVADIGPGGPASGWANEDYGGTERLDLIHADFGRTSGESQVLADGTLEVWHVFRPVPETPNLYEIEVLIINATSVEHGNLRTVTPAYRRVMDWDVEPTAFSEYVTVSPVGHIPPELAYSSDDGFAHPDPLTGPSYLLAEGTFVDIGPNDIGTLIDLEFDDLAPGESVNFTMWYGAAGNETDALAAIASVGADLYALAQPDVPDGQTTGGPNTFIWAYASPVATTQAQTDTTTQTDDATVYNNSLPDATQGAARSQS